jgi:hypothetical protein
VRWGARALSGAFFDDRRVSICASQLLTTVDCSACRRVEGPGLVCTAALVTDAISGALQQLFGYIGGAVLFEVVDADAHSGRATVLLDQRCTQPH